jgi:hypothetical protein
MISFENIKNREALFAESYKKIFNSIIRSELQLQKKEFWYHYKCEVLVVESLRYQLPCFHVIITVKDHLIKLNFSGYNQNVVIRTEDVQTNKLLSLEKKDIKVFKNQDVQNALLNAYRYLAVKYQK